MTTTQPGCDVPFLERNIAIAIDAKEVQEFLTKPLGTCARPCYPDCNYDGQLTTADLGCFQTYFVAGDPYGDCNNDTQFTVTDFGCFQSAFVAGCP